MSNDPRSWMWADAIALLGRAEQLHRSVFNPAGEGGGPSWEPPADIFETERELWIMVALPGVTATQIQLRIENGQLVVSGERRLPEPCRTAKVHRLEIPLGRFERRLPLPAGHYELGRREFTDGCLLLTLTKAS